MSGIATTSDKASGILLGIVIAALLLCDVSAVSAQQPPPQGSKPTAAQEGFVPVDQLPPQQQESIPAARLVAIAYGFVWVMLLGYVWSIRRRLSTVERELQSVTRRVGSPGSRPS